MDLVYDEEMIKQTCCALIIVWQEILEVYAMSSMLAVLLQWLINAQKYYERI